MKFPNGGLRSPLYSSLPSTTRRDFLRKASLTAAGSLAQILTHKVHAVTQVQQQGAATAWVSTTETEPWQTKPLRSKEFLWDTLDVRVSSERVGPSLEGFGACFNELGWTSLQKLGATDREHILEEMFAPQKGANFNLCRMPIGANDFSRDWYSYDETPGDLALKQFSVANDEQTLVPFIHAAQRYNPQLRLWASPWSPPSWMKTNQHYAEAEQRPGWPPNGIRPDQVGHEGTDLFIHDDRYFTAYANYFGKFIDAYKSRGIPIGMVMPQNEFNSAQAFPSCTWTPAGLARFLKDLGPAMQQRGVNIFFGTLERDNPGLLDDVLADPSAGPWIRGVGVQWAGKGALKTIRDEHPKLKIYGSEQECGDGKNSWNYARYCWRLMKHYLDDGACAYMYWNLSLEQGGVSRWGWPQNSLVTVDAERKTFQYNHEYFVIKHVSHFVRPGARRLHTDGTHDDVLAFANTDGSVAVILRNEVNEQRAVDIAFAASKISITMEPDSIGTLLVTNSV